MNTLRIGIYGRVSREKQECENQLIQLREFASRQNWQIVGEYVDQGQSGAKAGNLRPEFSRMLEDASQKRFDLLLFWSLDRLSREGVSQTLDYLNRLNSWNVGFRSFSEPYLDSLGVFKDAVLAVLACIAKQERIRISERTIAGLQRAKRNGKILGRRPISLDVAASINQLRSMGVSIRKVAAQFGVSPAYVCKCKKLLK